MAATDSQPLLSEEQLLEAVTLFAQGKSRQEVAVHFIDTDERLSDLNFEDDTLKERLADLLRAADPTSSKFAKTKYSQHYSQHRQAVVSALVNRYEQVITLSVDLLQAELASLTEHEEALNHMLESARESTPIGTSEYLATLNARSSVRKQKIEITDKLLERLERLKNQSDPTF